MYYEFCVFVSKTLVTNVCSISVLYFNIFFFFFAGKKPQKKNEKRERKVGGKFVNVYKIHTLLFLSFFFSLSHVCLDTYVAKSKEKNYPITTYVSNKKKNFFFFTTYSIQTSETLLKKNPCLSFVR